MDRLAAFLIGACSWTAIVGLLLIFIFIGKEALPILTSPEVKREASLSKLLLPQSPREGAPPEFSWQPVSKKPKYSLLPLVVGTLKVAVIGLLIAIPLGIAAAIYTSEFAPPWVREGVKPVIELLAGIPSVVLGFFCLMVLAGALQEVFGWTYRLNAVVAGIGLSLGVIPIVYTVSEDALSAVPHSFRDGSLAMGATTWQTAWRVVLPAASPGIFAGCILGFGRSMGETMIVLMSSGNAAVLSWSPTDSARRIPATIAAEMGEVVVGSPHYHVLFFLGALLFIVTFLTNLLAQWWVRRLEKKLRGVG